MFFINQNVYHSWYPQFHQVNLVSGGITDKPVSKTRRVGLFFSGGVDSFHSLLEHRDEITDLVFVQGMDIELEYNQYHKRLAASMQEVADHYAKNLIVIETNMRELIDKYVPYANLGWKVALAASGLVLQPYLSKLRVALEYFPGETSGYATILLPLWNTEALEFILSDYDVPRINKVERLAEDDFVLEHLRVCHKKPEAALNCGRCEKCLRTMLSLEAFGVLDCCATFAEPLTPKPIRNMYVTGQYRRDFLRQNLDMLVKNQGDPRLIAAVRANLNRPEWLHKFRDRVGKIFRNLSIRTAS